VALLINKFVQVYIYKKKVKFKLHLCSIEHHIMNHQPL